MTHSATLEDLPLDPTGSPACLFCRFDDKNTNKVFLESANFYARYDNFPAAEGHAEIVPKRHVESFFDLSSAEVCEAFELMLGTKEELQQLFKPDGFTIGINDGRAAGRSIDHLHIHVIPRHKGDVSDPRGGIRQILPNCHPEHWGATH